MEIEKLREDNENKFKNLHIELQRQSTKFKYKIAKVQTFSN